MKKIEEKMIIIIISLFILLSLIGYLMNIDILKFSIKTETGHVIHFVSLYISLVVSIIYYVIMKLLAKNDNNK